MNDFNDPIPKILSLNPFVQGDRGGLTLWASGQCPGAHHQRGPTLLAKAMPINRNLQQKLLNFYQNNTRNISVNLHSNIKKVFL